MFFFVCFVLFFFFFLYDTLNLFMIEKFLPWRITPFQVKATVSNVGQFCTFTKFMTIKHILHVSINLLKISLSFGGFYLLLFGIQCFLRLGNILCQVWSIRRFCMKSINIYDKILITFKTNEMLSLEISLYPAIHGLLFIFLPRKERENIHLKNDVQL